MWPIAWSSGEFRLGTYGVIVGAGILLTLWLARHLGKMRGLDARKVNDVGLGLFIGGFLGSKLLGLLVEVGRGAQLDWSELRNAGAIHGGLLGGLLAFFLLTRWLRLPWRQLLDAYLPAVALGQAIGRIGCFAAGCCFGTPSELPWTVSFTHPAAHQLGGVPLGVSLHPVQLYDAALHLSICACLWWLYTQRRFVGALLGPWAMMEGAARLFAETFRGDLGRGVWFGLEWLSTGRVTAFGFLLMGALVIWWHVKKDDDNSSALAANRS